jgi:Dolichyl-phosphate-mannose-protein mannosyltransferase
VRRASQGRLLVAAFLLWALFAQSVASAPRLSITTDEGLHITSGYSYLRTGDLRLIEEHPPLVKALEVWPLLLLRDLGSPAQTTGWEQNNLQRVMKFFLLPYRPFDRLLFSARVPVMLLSLLLGAFVFRWASDWFGAKAGVLALGLYAFDPNIVAHSAIAATDLGAACFIFVACYFFWRYLRRPTRSTILLAGATLGLAAAAKVSALMLLPFFSALWLVRVAARRAGLLKSAASFLAILLLAFLTFWAVFRFELRPLKFEISNLKFDLPVPAASYLVPLNLVRSHLDAGRPTFLLGMNSEQGWWYYFPVAFALKTPLPTLVLLVAVLAGVSVQALRLWRRERSEFWPWVWRQSALLAFPAIYFAAAVTQPFNIGYRHLLPILPFVFVFVAQILTRTSGLSHRASFVPRRLAALSACLVASVLAAWYVIGTVSIFPHYLAYFNELAGGPANGYKSLVDSNLDWGQAWKELKSYLDTHGVSQVKLSVGGSNDPAIYDISYEPIAPMKGAPPVLPSRFNPAPGVYVLSANTYQGLVMADVNNYDWFRHRQPDAQIGYAMFVYTVRPLEPAPAWVAQCAAPATPLDEAVLAEGLGRADLRVIYFDCLKSWVWPQGAGWYVLPYAVARDPASLPSDPLSGAELGFEQRQSFEYPPFSIFLRQSQPDLARLATEGRVAPSDWPPTQAQSQGLPISTSTTLSGTLEWLGYTLSQQSIAPGQAVVLTTYWRVVAPPTQPLSILAHMLDAAGRVVVTGDGLGVPVEQWRAGDVIVQRHELAVPKDTPAGQYWVQTGVYSLADGARLPILDRNVVVGDRMLLSPIRVGR